MRHRRKGRRLGRSSSHRKALMKNLATALFLTRRDPDFFTGMFQSDGKTEVKPPRFPGRIVTTLHKAKETRPMIEKCITIAKDVLPNLAEAEKHGTTAERNTGEWKKWRESDNHKKWAAAMAPVVNARRRVFAMLRDNEAVRILFNEIAPEMADRNGGYTRILHMANVRLGDAGKQAIIELVGTEYDRVKKTSQKPEFASE